MVVSKQDGEEQVELSSTYVGNLIKNAEKKAKKRKGKGKDDDDDDDEEEKNDEDEDEDEGVSFYESKRNKTIIEEEDKTFQLEANQSLDLSVATFKSDWI